MRALVVVLGLSLLFSGCLVMSLHPFFTDKEGTFDPALLGTWSDKAGNATLTFKQTGPAAYAVTYLQHEIPGSGGSKKETGEPGEFQGHLGKVGKSVFLDLYPDDNSWDRLKNELLAIHLAPTHTVSRVWFDHGNLLIARLNHDWLKERLAAKKVKIAHEELEGSIALTATTAALKQFLVRYQAEPKAFLEPEEFHKQ